MDKQLLPNREAELARYKEHKNDVNDINYQKFVSPIVSAVMRDFGPNDKGLDFGAGPGPVLSKLLTGNGYQIRQYDPFFADYPELLEEKYDYIACCEVIEHLYTPPVEFRLLKKMLLQNGKLYCMTNIYDSSIDFQNWHYKNDSTHVFIYQAETIRWIKENFDFANVVIEGRLITFSR